MKTKSLLLLTLISLNFQQYTLADSTRAKIPAGAFNMGCSVSDTQCDKDEGPKGGTKVFVKSFSIDKNEVTVNQYRACIQSGKCSRPKDHKRNQYCNLDAVDRNNHPINCVDWQNAVDYCKTQNGRLPYEAEWEKAARAGSATAYPWIAGNGLSVNCNQAILDDGKTRGSKGDELDGCGEDRTWPISSRPANQYGLFDMHGNVGEWINNWYTANAISDNYAKGDLIGAKSGKQRLVRGGSWDENSQNLRSSFRNVKPPVSGKSIYGSIGFRCAYD